MAITSANMGNLYDARINKAYFLNLNIWETEYKSWCDVRGSKKQFEKVSQYGEVPMPPALGEYENAAETHFQQGPVRTWTHTKFGFTLIASRESFEDDLFGIIVQTGAAMGEATHHRIETEGVSDLNIAFTTNTVGPSDTADETLCATSHATFVGAAGASQANAPTTDVTLGADSLWAGVDNFASLKDRQGNPVRAIPRELIIAPANERTAIEILKSVEVPYKTTNEINAIKTRGLAFTISHYLDASLPWFLVTDKKPIRFYMRRAPNVTTDTNKRNDSRSWLISTRLSHAPYDWYQIYGTDGAP